METSKFRSCFYENRPSGRPASAKVKETVKVLAVGILALFAFGFFTSSERLNAG